MPSHLRTSQSDGSACAPKRRGAKAGVPSLPYPLEADAGPQDHLKNQQQHQDGSQRARDRE